ncbi:MAG: hypothetical protein ACSHW0_07420 [Thalassotalea sp.]
MPYLSAVTRILILLLISSQALAAEFSAQGVVDVRLTHNDTITSFRDGGYGKFDLTNGENFSLAQAGISIKAEWDSGLSAHIVANGYQQNNTTRAGLTEGYLKYLSLPNESGYRWQSKLGFFYPEISLENNAIAWASKNTLNSSAINTWIGEEVRVLGNEYSLVRLGKFHDSQFDVSGTLGVFKNNDPSGALLAWHGWTVGNRQTLWTEKVTLPPLLALQTGNPLDGQQAVASDPFYEVDNNFGWHGNAKLKWHKKGKILVGYYNNKAQPFLVEKGQYGWRTRFYHLGFEWHFTNAWQLTGQYLYGDTLMQNSDRDNIVKNDYSSAYLALSKRFKQHRYTLRVEEFSVRDKDSFAFDNNNETGNSFTVNYTYRWSKPLFLALEHNWINSTRYARAYSDQKIKLIEQQSQLSLRYFF